MFNQFCLNFLKLPEAALLELSSTTATLCPAEQGCQARAGDTASCGTTWHSMAQLLGAALTPVLPVLISQLLELTAHPSVLVPSAGRGGHRAPSIGAALGIFLSNPAFCFHAAELMEPGVAHANLCTQQAAAGRDCPRAQWHYQWAPPSPSYLQYLNFW